MNYVYAVLGALGFAAAALVGFLPIYGAVCRRRYARAVRGRR